MQNRSNKCILRYANKFSKRCTATHPSEFDIVLSSPKMTIVTRKFEYLVNWTMRSWQHGWSGLALAAASLTKMADTFHAHREIVWKLHTTMECSMYVSTLVFRINVLVEILWKNACCTKLTSWGDTRELLIRKSTFCQKVTVHKVQKSTS